MSPEAGIRVHTPRSKERRSFRVNVSSAARRLHSARALSTLLSHNATKCVYFKFALSPRQAEGRRPGIDCDCRRAWNLSLRGTISN